MSAALLKYNPGLVRDDELIKGFVVRVRDFEWILEIISSNTTLEANQHVLIVGPRGSGKTTLVRRVELEVKSNRELSRSWYPVVFSEEAYAVSSPGEFWLEVLFHIYNATGDDKWRRIRDSLAKESNDAVLRDLALGQVLEYADDINKKLILIVENLNMLLSQLQANSDWELRHALLNESRIMLLGTATSKFSELENVDRAWYELFAVHELKPLNTKDSLTLWKSYTGAKAPLRQVQALRILTGGNPRLFRILSDFVIKASFRELMDNLTRLIDEHTEYFKGSLDNLSALERKVFVALLERWDPCDARQIAADARLDVSKTSALLHRLVEKGRVVTIPALARKRRYQVAERMFNIYYLMRRRGQPADRVRAFVRFMVQFYRDDSLVEMVAGIAREACLLGSDQRQDHYSAYAEVLRSGLDVQLCSRILRCTEPEFFKDRHIPRSVKRLAEIIELPEVTDISEATALLRKAIDRRPDDSELPLLLERIIEQKPKVEDEFSRELSRSNTGDAKAWVWLATKLHDLYLFEDAYVATEKAIARDPMNPVAWRSRAELLFIHLTKEREEGERAATVSDAETAIRKAIELDPTVGWCHGLLASILRSRGELTDAEKEVRKGLELDQKSDGIWAELGAIKLRQHDLLEAENALRKALEIDANDAYTWGELGLVLAHDDKRTDEAVAAYRQALRINDTDLFAWSKLVRLKARTDTNEALISLIEECFRKLKRTPSSVVLVAWIIYDYNRFELFPRALEWVRAAVEDFAGDWKLSHTLATLLAATEDWNGAIDAIPAAVAACVNSEEALENVTNFLISAAANGYASKVLTVIEQYGKTPALEPLAIGVRLYTGEHPVVAQEVLEVGEDVAKRIREFKLKSSAS